MLALYNQYRSNCPTGTKSQFVGILYPIQIHISQYVHPQNEQHPNIVGRTYPIQIFIWEHVNAPTLCPKGTQTPPNLTTLNNCWQYISHTIYTYAFLYLCICIFRYDTSEYYCWHPCTELLSKRQHVPRNMKNSPLDGVVQSYKSYTVRGKTLYVRNLQNKYQAMKQ